MESHPFLQLCESYCALRGVEPGPMKPELNGAMSFSAPTGPYNATVAYSDAMSTADAFVRLDIGAMPDGCAETALKALLQINMAAFGKNSPVVGMTEREHVVIQLTLPLATLSADELHHRLSGLAEWAYQLREEFWHRIEAARGATPNEHRSLA